MDVLKPATILTKKMIMHAFILISTFAIFSVVLSATIRRFQLVPSWLDDLKILSVCLVMSPIVSFLLWDPSSNFPNANSKFSTFSPLCFRY